MPSVTWSGMLLSGGGVLVAVTPGAGLPDPALLRQGRLGLLLAVTYAGHFLVPSSPHFSFSCHFLLSVYFLSYTQSVIPASEEFFHLEIHSIHALPSVLPSRCPPRTVPTVVHSLPVAL